MITNFTKISFLFFVLCCFNYSGYAKTRKKVSPNGTDKKSWSGFTSLAVDARGISAITYPNSVQPNKLKFAVDPPTATGGTSCGPGSVTLTANGGTDGNYRWYTSPTGGTAISNAINATYITPVLVATTTYYVSVVSGIEESEEPW